jgi:protein-S-isoprenylcysteine O-methyltransferase Ste14
MRSPAAATRFLLDRVIPASLFGCIGLLALIRLGQSWTDPQVELQYMKLGHAILSIVFMAILATLFVIRRAPIGQRASPLAKAAAMGGTFISWVILAQPPTIDDVRVLALSDLLMFAGVLFTIYALGTLGKCFGIAPEARGLVISGPYRWVRNPAYLAEFVTVIGGVLPLLAPLTVLLFAAFCLLQLRRIALEETVLNATFPEYAEYRRRTPALVPWRLPWLSATAN